MEKLISEIEMEIEALQRRLTFGENRKERLQRVSEDLRNGCEVTDLRFDQVYPLDVRRYRDARWLPVEVALRAIGLLVTDSGTRVLDVGSGCGKFCVIGALSSPARFSGVESHPELVAVARQSIEELDVPRTSFSLGDAETVDWSRYNAFYLSKPLQVELVKARLDSVPSGTKVAVYQGFGESLPRGYRLIQRELIASSYLELWIKDVSV